MRQDVLHTGVLARPLPSLDSAISYLIELLYAGKEASDTPISGKSKPKTERNSELKRLSSQGWTQGQLADYFGISIQRVSQILKGL
jgi:DNA-binding NarL/FixJ family response regulator